MNTRQADPTCTQCLQLEALAEQLDDWTHRLIAKDAFGGLKRLHVERELALLEEKRAAHFASASHARVKQSKKLGNNAGLFLVKKQAHEGQDS
jgi:hypothetical protein